jgi:DNA-directed RNA polymerase I, II, and III subunit RPABC2
MSKKPEYDENSDMESDVDNMNSDDDDDDDGPKQKKVLKKIATEEYGSDDDDVSIGDDIEDIENQSDMEEDDRRYDFPSSTASDMNVRRRIIGEEEEDEDEDEDEDEYDENYLQKFDESLKQNVIAEYHPELIAHNYEEVEALCRVVRDENGIIMDPLHKTMPFITKYEKAKILGERAKQINSGAQATVAVDENIIDGYLIALKEYENKSIPMIIRRPLPSGGCEYWRLADLELIV